MSIDLVSGATGFIGGRLCRSLQAGGFSCRSMGRRPEAGIPLHVIADLADKQALFAACTGVDRVFHCAGYAHAFDSQQESDAARHWQVNFEGTRNLVEAAAQAGVKAFVFLSSVKAMAEPGDTCADEDFPGLPETAYGQSKRAAEEVVLAAGQRYGMHVVCLRLTMVYGAGGRGNLERMRHLVRRGLFPPLPETKNRRSMVHVDDAVSAMRLVAGDARASGRTYIVTGAEAPSGRQLFDALRAVQGLPTCGWAVPEPVLRLAAKTGDGLEWLLGRRLLLDSETLDRLLGSACYSSQRIIDELGWHARMSLADGLAEMLR